MTRTLKRFVCLVAGTLMLTSVDAPMAAAKDATSDVYSAFGPYAPLPAWSGWCGLAADPAGCAEPLDNAVQDPGPDSRKTVRGHGWPLWAAIWSPIQAAGFSNDVLASRTDFGGTTGCWSELAGGGPACSGIYPIWITWPNTGAPYKPGDYAAEPATATAPAAAKPKHLLEINRSLDTSTTAGGAQSDPDPTQVATVFTLPKGDVPVYALPPLVLHKQCGIDLKDAQMWLEDKEYDQIEKACEAAGASGLFCTDSGAVCDGTAFVNQGDVMIATESMSAEAYEDVQSNQLYDKQVQFGKYQAREGSIAGSLGDKFVVTKHMFWPVKGCKPGVAVGEPGCRVRYGALPPWVPANFRDKSYATNAEYLGYETWGRVVAIDTQCDENCAAADSATLELAHVTGPGIGAITTDSPNTYGVGQFVHVQVSDEVLQKHFTPADRALLDQATIWAYGDGSNGFEAGDFLVVIAMHVNTKEIHSWAFQSVWWAEMNDAIDDCPLDQYNHCFGQSAAYAATETGTGQPNAFSGLTHARLDTLDAEVGTAWRDNYLMTDAYGIGYEIDGAVVELDNYFAPGTAPAWASTGPDGEPLPLLPVSQNVYVEPVIHPIGSNCQNCHRRAGFRSSGVDFAYPEGGGTTSSQTAQCPSLLGDYGYLDRNLCLTEPWAWHSAGGNDCREASGDGPRTLCDGTEAFPILSTDWSWFISDIHVQQR